MKKIKIDRHKACEHCWRAAALIALLAVGLLAHCGMVAMGMSNAA